MREALQSKFLLLIGMLNCLAVLQAASNIVTNEKVFVGKLPTTLSAFVLSKTKALNELLF